MPIESTADPLRRLCLGQLKNIPAQVISILLVAVQAALLDYHLYVSHGMKSEWFGWIGADVVAIILMIAGFRFREWRLPLSVNHKEPSNFQKGLPLAPISWCIYAILVAAKISIIFKKDLQFDVDINYLKIAVCGTAVICMYFTMGHHHLHESIARRNTIISLIKTFTIDLLDIIDLLDVLYEGDASIKLQTKLNTGLEDAVLVLMTLNLVRPALVLFSLFMDHFASKKNSLITLLVKTLVELLLVNVPLLIIRIHMHTQFNDFISVFLVKNVLGIHYGLLECYDAGYELYMTKRKQSSARYQPNTLSVTDHNENQQNTEQFDGYDNAETF